MDDLDAKARNVLIFPTSQRKSCAANGRGSRAADDGDLSASFIIKINTLQLAFGTNSEISFRRASNTYDPSIYAFIRVRTSLDKLETLRAKECRHNLLQTMSV